MVNGYDGTFVSCEERATRAMERIADSLESIAKWPALAEGFATTFKNDFARNLMESVLAGSPFKPSEPAPAADPVGDPRDVCRCGLARDVHLAGDGPCLVPNSQCERFELRLATP